MKEVFMVTSTTLVKLVCPPYSLAMWSSIVVFVGKLTGPKINLIMQHKTKNPDLLPDSIHDIKTEHI
jgi:LEA14-like dessication related protein